MLAPALCALALLAASPAPLDDAQRHLDAGNLDEVLFALQGQSFAGADKANAELADRQAATSEVKALEAQLRAAQERAAQAPKSGPRFASSRKSNTVVLYRTSWCGYCRKAAAFLSERNVPFVEKDIEKDKDAADELARKAAAAGVKPRGVPVIDVKGKLVLGFDRQQLERLLD